MSLEKIKVKKTKVLKKLSNNKTNKLLITIIMLKIILKNNNKF